MHIGIEAHGFWGNAEGQAKYVQNLISALARLDRENRYTLFFNSLRQTRTRRATVLNRLGQNFRAVFFPIPNVPHPMVCFLKERVFWPALARRLGVEVFHSTSYRGVFAEGMNTVLSIHDFAYHAHPEVFTRRSLAYYRRLPLDAARARLVTTLSDYSRQDAVRILGLPLEKIRTVYAGVDLDRFNTSAPLEAVRAVKEKYGIRGGGILFVGNLNPKKNLLTLIRAFRKLRTKGVTDFPLVLVGKHDMYKEDLSRAIEEWSLTPHVIFTGFVPNADLPLLYRAADLFVFPSLFEGFGLPVLESMACGTPVVASNTTSLPEVAGDAAVLVDPTDVNQITEAMGEVLCDGTLRSDLVEKGFRRVRFFSWDRGAQAALGAYRDAFDASDQALARRER